MLRRYRIPSSVAYIWQRFHFKTKTIVVEKRENKNFLDCDFSSLFQIFKQKKPRKISCFWAQRNTAKGEGPKTALLYDFWNQNIRLREALLASTYLFLRANAFAFPPSLFQISPFVLKTFMHALNLSDRSFLSFSKKFKYSSLPKGPTVISLSRCCPMKERKLFPLYFLLIKAKTSKKKGEAKQSSFSTVIFFQIFFSNKCREKAYSHRRQGEGRLGWQSARLCFGLFWMPRFCCNSWTHFYVEKNMRMGRWGSGGFLRGV